jgi:feruloyl esterase
MNTFKPLVIIWLLFSSANVMAKQTDSAPDSLVVNLRQRINRLSLEGLTITDIQMVPQGKYTPAATGKELEGLPAFCRIAVTLRPTPQSEIKMELWLPQSNWNGRLLGTGNGGGAGSIVYASLAGGIKKGYATANTDMGTSRGGANGAIDNPGVWADFGYRATHLMTVASKAMLNAYYGKAQHHAYFTGCSTGGQQALMEAQRFPGDYNGIIAGAPANNRTHLHTGFLLNYKVTNAGTKPLFTNAELSFITRKITAAYAAQTGGAPGDNFLTDPRMIRVDFEALFKCKNGSKDTCLSDAQIAALKKIYAGPVNPKTHEQIYASPPVGSENVGGGLSSQQTASGANGLFYQFKWVFGDHFDFNRFDFDKDQARIDSILAPLLNANSPDLSEFKKLSGKMIMYTGTADPLVPYADALNYYERVIERQHGLKQTQQFFRYYLIPGMGHCGGGPGLNGFSHDILTDLVNWVEQDKAPDRLVATAFNCCVVNGAPRFERPVFPYPKFAKYVGGDVNAASSYIYMVHKRNGVIKPADSYLK